MPRANAKPIVKPAPPVAQRPLCCGCGRALLPDYVEVWADALDGPSVFGAIWDDANRGRAQARVWRGDWKGWGTHVDGIPTHCSVTCAAKHGTRLARLLLTGLTGGPGAGSVVLNDEGRRRFTTNRPDPRNVAAARDVLSSDDENPNE